MEPKTRMLYIEFLDGHPRIAVESRPCIHYDAADGVPAYDTTDLHIGWGDRETTLHECPRDVPCRIEMRPPVVYVARDASVPPAEVARVQRLVDTLWSTTPSVAGSCEAYRLIAQSIHDSYLVVARP